MNNRNKSILILEHELSLALKERNEAKDRASRAEEVLIALQRQVAELERAKLKVCSVQLVKKDYEQVIQILGVHETPDGLIIRVAE